MATTKLLFAAGAALMLLALLTTPAPAAASQLNMYEGPGCTGNWRPCWDRQCCAVTYTGSYRFYYNDGWPAYLYQDSEGCAGNANSILTSTIDCTDGFDYKSVKLGSSSEEQLIKLPRNLDAGKK